MRAVMRMSMCPVCQGLGEVKPCGHYCLNVFKGCLAYHADLGVEWDNYVGTFLFFHRSQTTTLFCLSLLIFSIAQPDLFFDVSILHLLCVCVLCRCFDESGRSTFGTFQHRTGCRSDRYQNLWRHYEFPGERLRDFSKGIYPHIFRLLLLVFNFSWFFFFFSIPSNHCYWCISFSHKWWFVARCGSLRLSAKLLFEYLFFFLFFGCRKEGIWGTRKMIQHFTIVCGFSRPARFKRRKKKKKAKWMRTAYF